MSLSEGGRLEFVARNFVDAAPMTVRLSLLTPAALSVTSVTNADWTEGTVVAEVPPATNRTATVALSADTVGTFTVEGALTYSFGDDSYRVPVEQVTVEVRGSVAGAGDGGGGSDGENGGRGNGSDLSGVDPVQIGVLLLSLIAIAATWYTRR
jgi:hypothetical protein